MWVDPLNTFHPDIPYILAGVRLVNRYTKEFKPVDPGLMDALRYVKGIDVSRFINYDDQIVVYSQFGLELAEDYEKDSTEINRHLIPVIAFIEDYFEPDPNSKVVLTDLAEAYRSKYHDIHDSTFSRIVGMWGRQFPKTTYHGKSAFAGLRPKAQYVGIVEVQEYTPVEVDSAESDNVITMEDAPNPFDWEDAMYNDYLTYWDLLAYDPVKIKEEYPLFCLRSLKSVIKEIYSDKGVTFMSSADLYEQIKEKLNFQIQPFWHVSRLLSNRYLLFGLDWKRRVRNGKWYTGYSLK